MTQARKYIWNENLCAHYHIINRCVQRAFLLLTETATGEIDEHRKIWVQERLAELSEIFTIVIGTFSVMSNHLHIIVQTRPDLTELLTDEEVAKRWLKLYPPKKSKKQKLTPEQWQAYEYEITSNEKLLKEYRKRLGSLSWFMKAVSEPIARMANKESNCTGRFWQGRYISKLLTGGGPVIAAAIYTDLNPIRANLAEAPETSQFTGTYERIQANQAREKIETINEYINAGNAIHKDKKEEIQKLSQKTKSADWLAPFLKDNENETMEGESLARSESGEPVGLRTLCEQKPPFKPFFKINEKDYLDLLDWTGRELHPKKSGVIPFDIPHIFERLKIDKYQWLETIKNYDKLFYRIVGKISDAWELLKDTVNQWFKGSAINRKLFGD